MLDSVGVEPIMGTITPLWLEISMPTEPLFKRFYDKVKINKETGCHEWQAAMTGKASSGDRYGAFYFQGKHIRAHRMAWMIEVGEIPKDKIIMHKCDNPSCVNVDHLQVGTKKDNSQDMIAKGRKNPAKGERVHTSKLTEADILAIRAIDGRSMRNIAAEYGTDHKTISKIRKRESWAHIPPADTDAKIAVPPRKLTDDQVREIRAKGEEGQGMRSIARDFGIHHGTVSGIINGTLRASVN